MRRAIIFVLIFMSLTALDATTTPPIPTKSSRPPHFIERCQNGKQQIDDCFKDLPLHLMEFLQDSKEVVSQKKIVAQCNVFDKCMKCFNDYSARCPRCPYIKLFKKDNVGVINFFEKFCEEKDFQRDYMRYKSCFVSKKEDWITCTADIEKALIEELSEGKRNSTNILLQFCCDYLVFENCKHTENRYLGFTNSSQFVCKVIKMLSTKDYIRDCPQLGNACSCAPRMKSLCICLLPLILALLLQYLFVYISQQMGVGICVVSDDKNIINKKN